MECKQHLYRYRAKIGDTYITSIISERQRNEYSWTMNTENSFSLYHYTDGDEGSCCLLPGETEAQAGFTRMSKVSARDLAL